MNTIKGIILNELIFKNETYKYTIQDMQGNEKTYTSFKNRFSIFKYINITYKTSFGNYGEQNIISSFFYDEFVDDNNHITLILKKMVRFTMPQITSILKKFPTDCFNTMIKYTNEFNKNCSESVVNKLEPFIEFEKKVPNTRLHIIKKFTEWNIPKPKNNVIDRIVIHFGDNIKQFDLSLENCIYELCTKTVIDPNVECSKCKNEKSGCQDEYTHKVKIGMKFKDSDTIAIRIFNKNEYDEKRLSIFINYLWDYLDCKGIQYLEANKLHEYCNNEFHQLYCYDKKIKVDYILPLLKKVTMNNIDYYTTNKIFDAERYVEKFCSDLSCQPVGDFDMGFIDEVQQLDKMQLIALGNAINHKISVITGPPGSGKTHVIGNIIDQSPGENIFLLAPTGAAIERIKQIKIKTTDLKFAINETSEFAMVDIAEFVHSEHIKTIHSFILSIKLQQFKYYGNGNQCIGDMKDPNFNINDITIIIDEMSMVSLDLFAKFLKACDSLIKHRSSIKIICLGDWNQLPAIQSGNVLDDLINSKVIISTEFTKVFRTNCEEITENAKRAIQGENISPINNFIHINVYKDADAISSLNDCIDKYDLNMENTTILSPINKRNLGVNNLNKILQNKFNEYGSDTALSKYTKQDDKTEKITFKIGDKVMYTKNCKKLDIYNGTLLYIENYDAANDKLHCRLYEDAKRTVHLNSEQSSNLVHAFAISIHKSQGQGFPTVIIMLDKAMVNVNRNMFYTAITRSKIRCIIIGSQMALNNCKKIMEPRLTTLFKKYMLKL